MAGAAPQGIASGSPPGTAPADPRDLRIAGRRVQPDLNRVTVGTETFQLEPKIMGVLLCLAERPGEVVTKEQLLERVWAGTFVTEDVLTRAVGELRRVFGDEPAHPRVIETIRKKGYRLLLAPEAGPSATTAGAPEERPTTPDRSPVSAPPTDRRRVIAATAAALALVVTVVAGFRLAREGSRERPPLRLLPLTSYPGDEIRPALSPDGSRVAFSWNGGSGTGFSIYVKLVDSEAPLRLTEGPGHDVYPAWSPDGTRVAFSRLSGGRCDVYTVPALGGPVRRLAPCGSADAPELAWSPDGAWLALSKQPAGEPIRLQLLPAAGGEARDLTRPPAGVYGDWGPAFSPDGRTLAFVRSLAEGVDDVFTVPVAGGDPTRLTFDNNGIAGLTWPADGRGIVFSSRRAGLYSLWRVPSGGGTPGWVAGGGTKLKHPSAARAKNTIAYESWIFDANLWRLPLGAGGEGAERAPAAVTSSTDEWNFAPGFSPDGRRIAFASTRTGNTEIWASDVDGAHAVQLTSFGGAHLGTPDWSPDGRRLVFAARPDGQADLYTLDVSGGPPAKLTSDAGDEVMPAWSRDGRSVYFASRKSGSWQVWRVRLGDGRWEQVTTNGGYAARESYDGRSVYFSRIDARGIWQKPRDGGEERLVVPELSPQDYAEWRPTREGIVFTRHRGDDDPLVMFQPFGGREPVVAGTLAQEAWCAFSVSPDGRWLAYSRTQRRTSDIKLLDGF